MRVVPGRCARQGIRLTASQNLTHERDIYRLYTAARDNLLAIDENVGHGTFERAKHQTRQRVAKRLHGGVGEIDNREVGLTFRFESANIVAQQGARGVDRRGVENVAKPCRGYISGADLAEHGSPAHLVDEVVREGIRANGEVDPAPQVFPEIVEQDTPPRKDAGAMRHGHAVSCQPLEIFGRAPADPWVLVDINGVDDGGSRMQE